MKMKCNNKITSFILCMMLIVAMAFVATGCNDTKEETKEPSQTEVTSKPEETSKSDGKVLGEGATKFECIVVDQDGTESVFEIHTDKKTVGEALQEVKLIEGEEGPYGLYINTVNGITADYDTDGTYWAFYIDDEYAVTGVDVTTITDGASYMLKREK